MTRLGYKVHGGTQNKKRGRRKEEGQSDWTIRTEPDVPHRGEELQELARPAKSWSWQRRVAASPNATWLLCYPPPMSPQEKHGRLLLLRSSGQRAAICLARQTAWCYVRVSRERHLSPVLDKSTSFVHESSFPSIQRYKYRITRQDNTHSPGTNFVAELLQSMP